MDQTEFSKGLMEASAVIVQRSYLWRIIWKTLGNLPLTCFLSMKEPLELFCVCV